LRDGSRRPGETALSTAHTDARREKERGPASAGPL